nr:chitobiase/beta-hexosaminidase C-terminal domain-containing protein [Lachnospiraceae bacterium]
MPETGINLSGVGITGAALLILAAAVILMSEVITMTMIVTSAREKLNAGRLIIIAAITSFINFAVFLFLQFHESLSLGLSGMILRLLRLEFTYQNAYSFVMISGLCLIGGFLLGLLFEVALFGRINGIRLGQGWALMLAVIIWSTAYFAAERMEVYSEESINIISADRNVRHIENDVPVLSDQVVIANSGKLLCSMEDFYLTDNKDRMSRMSLGNTYASAGERITLSVDDSFSLREGDPVYLYDSRGNLVSSYPDEENTTPGMPVLSSASGFYAEPFELTITAGENETIYYSLDGSDPVKHGVPYTEPIHVYDRSEEETVFRSYPRTHYDWQFETEQDTSPVDRCFVVKAAAVDKAGRISDTVTGSYFINKDQYAGKVISLTADPEDLFGEYGICVTGKAYDEWALSGEISNAPKPNFEKRGREWEIPGIIELFDGNAYVMTDRSGLRVAGGSSRSDPIKRFSAYARPELGGSDYFSIDFFEDNSDVHAIVLRPSSVNAVFPLLTSDRDVLGMRSFPVTVFLNGEYWYDTYLGEKYTAEYFNTYFDIS